MTHLLEVKNLDIFFKNNEGKKDFHVVRHVGFNLRPGEVLGIVGESGSGKSLTALSLLGLLPYPKAYHSKKTSIKFKGEELIDNPALRHIRGGKIGFVFQEPMSSLNPLHTVEQQIAEAIMIHQNISRTKARHEVLRLLKQTGIQNPRARLKAYPHQLSGGQRQRVMIAMAIANRPDILIADEPTTALDVTVQKQIIELLLKLRHELDMSLIFISHDLHLIHRIADNVLVMHHGMIIERGNCAKIFNHPENSYTKRLISSRNILKNNTNITSDIILKAQEISVRFPLIKNFWGNVKQYLYAVNKLSFTLHKGQTLGIVGESGSGKTTLGLAVCNLISFTGKIILNGRQTDDYPNRQLRKELQIVFQDPYNSLNPRMTIRQIVGEGLEVHYPRLTTEEKSHRIETALKDVGLSPAALNKYPHEFSGGQRQRIAIARALILDPKIIVLDEPTSALDVTIQRQIINLLLRLQQQRQLSYIFISHDINAVRAVSDQIMVMKDGLIVECGPTAQILAQPKQQYTQNLIGASAFVS